MTRLWGMEGATDCLGLSTLLTSDFVIMDNAYQKLVTYQRQHHCQIVVATPYEHVQI